MSRFTYIKNTFSNYCTTYRSFLPIIRDYRHFCTIHNRAREKEKVSFKQLVWRIYFDDYKLLRISEYYEQPNGYNFHNEAVFIDYNKISTLGR